MWTSPLILLYLFCNSNSMLLLTCYMDFFLETLWAWSVWQLWLEMKIALVDLKGGNIFKIAPSLEFEIMGLLWKAKKIYKICPQKRRACNLLYFGVKILYLYGTTSPFLPSLKQDMTYAQLPFSMSKFTRKCLVFGSHSCMIIIRLWISSHVKCILSIGRNSFFESLTRFSN